MEFLVEFEVNVPEGTPASDVQHRENAEATAAAKLVDEGHLLRVWKLRAAPGGGRKVLGLYRAKPDPARLSTRGSAAPRVDASNDHPTRTAPQ